MADDHDPSDKELAALWRRMHGRPRKRPVTFWVQALQDGTIVFAAAQRRPYHKKGTAKPFVDEDGCFAWSRFDQPVLVKLTEAQRIIAVLSMTQKLNTKKLLREQVEARLERIEEQIEAIAARLDRIAPQSGADGQASFQMQCCKAVSEERSHFSDVVGTKAPTQFLV